VAVSPDGKFVAAALRKPGGKVGLWEVTTGKPGPVLQASRNDVISLAFSPDGRRLAVGSGTSPLDGSPGASPLGGIWDWKAGKELCRLQGPGHLVHTVAFAPGEKVLAGANGDKTVRLWDAATGKELCRCVGHRAGVYAVAFTPDGKTLFSSGAAGDGVVRMWDPATGKERILAEGHLHRVYKVVFLPDSRTVVSVGHQEIRVWRALTGEGLGQLTEYPYDRSRIALSPDGRVAALQRPNRDLEFWDLPRRKLIRKVKGPHFWGWRMAVSPDELLALAASELLWVNEASGRPFWRTIGQNRAHFEALAFSRDGKRIAGVTQGLVNNRKLQNQAELWDAATGKRLRSWELDWLAAPAVALSPDGALVAVAGRRNNVLDNKPGRAEVYDAATGKRRYTLVAHPNGLMGVAFSADGRALATGGYDGEVRVWEVATGQLQRRFTGHAGKIPADVRALAFSPDGRLLVSGCELRDPIPLVWDLTGRLRDGKLVPARLTEERLAGCWEGLRAADAAAAHDRIWELAAAPRQAVAFLATKLRPLKAPAPGHLERLVKDLGSDRFAVRSRVEKELQELADLAAGALRQAAAKGASLEVRRRADRLLQALASPSGETLQAIRAVEALERCGAEARPLLTALAGGAPEARLTREARAALARLAEGEKGR
jgi:WD40 repeat protein